MPQRYYDIVKDGMKVRVGVRPTDIYVGGPDSKGTPVRVAVFEDLCTERRLGIRVGDELVMLITEDETKYEQGDLIRLEVNGEKTHLFDLETGNRIQ